MKSKIKKILTKFTYFLNSKSNRLTRSLYFDSLEPDKNILITTSDGLYFMGSTSDRAITRSVYINQNAYNSRHLIKCMKLLKFDQINTLYEVGANIGTIGIYALKNELARKCVAFEPEPNNFRYLKINSSLNNVEENYELYETGLSNENSNAVKFEIKSENHGAHRILLDSTDYDLLLNKNSILIRTQMLNEYFSKNVKNGSLVFVDAEGFEGHILSGASKFIMAKIPICLEFWPYALKNLNGFELLKQSLINAPYERIYD